MHLFVVEYWDNKPIAFEVWECKEKCEGCPGKFFCYTAPRVWVNNCLGIIVNEHERVAMGEIITLNNDISKREGSYYLKYLTDEELKVFGFKEEELAKVNFK